MARVAVMDVADKLAAQSPRKLHGPKRARRAGDTEIREHRARRALEAVGFL